MRSCGEVDAASRDIPSPPLAVDFTVFTLQARHPEPQKYSISPDVFQLLGGFYQLVQLAINTRQASKGSALQQQLLAKWILMRDQLLSFNHCTTDEDRGIFSAVFRAIYIFSNISELDRSSENHSALIEGFRILLQQTNVDTNWSSLPGALIWCLIIAPGYLHSGLAVNGS